MERFISSNPAASPNECKEVFFFSTITQRLLTLITNNPAWQQFLCLVVTKEIVPCRTLEKPLWKYLIHKWYDITSTASCMWCNHFLLCGEDYGSDKYWGTGRRIQQSAVLKWAEHSSSSKTQYRFFVFPVCCCCIKNTRQFSKCLLCWLFPSSFWKTRSALRIWGNFGTLVRHWVIFIL